MDYFTAVIMVLLAILLLSIVEITFRKFPKFALVLFVALPVLLTPTVWANNGVTDWFRWVKIYSVILGASLILIYRLTKLKHNYWYKWTLPFILVGNILEAVMQDFSQKNIFNSLNAIAGLLLIFPVLNVKSISTDETSTKLFWNATSRGWIIGYTIWNWMFVVLNYNEYSVHHIVVLTAPLIVGLIDHRIWFEARAYTLGINLIGFFTFTKQHESLTTTLFNNQWLFAIGSIISFSFMIIFTFYTLYKKFKIKANMENITNKEELEAAA